jgi:hypothetical protein
MPIPVKQAADTVLHSRKCSCTDAGESPDAAATIKKDMDAAMKIQYRLPNSPSHSIAAYLYLMEGVHKTCPGNF